MLAANFGIILVVIAFPTWWAHRCTPTTIPIGRVYRGVGVVWGCQLPKLHLDPAGAGPAAVGAAQPAAVAVLFVLFGGFGLLYFTGTRLTYYGAILMVLLFCVVVAAAAAVAVLHPVGVGLGVAGGFRGASPMAERQALTGTPTPSTRRRPTTSWGRTRTTSIKRGKRSLQRSGKDYPGVHRGVRQAGGFTGPPCWGPDRRVWPGSGDGAVSIRYRPGNPVQFPGESSPLWNGLAGTGCPHKDCGVFEYAKCHMGSHIYDPKTTSCIAVLLRLPWGGDVMGCLLCKLCWPL